MFISLLLSFSGFAWGVLHDIAALRRVPKLKPALFLLSAAGHLTGLYRLLARSPRFDPPAPLRAVCIVLAPLAWLAMFYSVLFEVSFRKAWLKEGHTDTLVTTGTYALTRHPGVLWFTLAALTSAVATRSKHMLIAGPLIALGDVGHVLFQEKVVLTEVFGNDYRTYQQTTPFVVPTPTSTRRFVSTAWRAEGATSEMSEAPAPQPVGVAASDDTTEA